MSGEPEQILVVDDDEDVRKTIANILQVAGYGVATADDGAAALTAIRLSRPDLVLLDAMMPVLDGFAVLRALRTTPDPPPVVGITAISDHEAFARFLTTGAVAYVCKPIAMRQLLQVVRQAIDGARQKRDPRSPEAQREHMVGVRVLGAAGAPTLLGEMKEVTPDLARVILIAPLEVGSRVRVVLHVSIAGRALGFEAVVQWCAAGPHGFVHGLGALQASKEAWDRLLSLHGVPAGDD
jgi:two-component system OmpR family response regulator